MTRPNPLKRLRTLLKMSQADVAQRMGVSQPNYQRWESGAAPIPKTKIKKLAKVLDSTEGVVGGAVRYALVSPAILDDNDGYWGEVTVHFASGGPAIVASISAEERRRLQNHVFDQTSEFLEVVGLCNEAYLIRRRAVSEVYLSDEAVDTVSPAEHECEEFLPIPLVDARLWDVLSSVNQGLEDWAFPREEVVEALSYFMTAEEIASVLMDMDDTPAPAREKSMQEWAAEEMFRRLGIATAGVDGSCDAEERMRRKTFLLSRATETVIRLSRGAERRYTLTRGDDLADNYRLLSSLGEGERDLMRLWPDDDQMGVISTDVVDWVRFPRHYLRRALEGEDLNLYGLDDGRDDD